MGFRVGFLSSILTRPQELQVSLQCFSALATVWEVVLPCGVRQAFLSPRIVKQAVPLLGSALRALKFQDNMSLWAEEVAPLTLFLQHV